MPPSLAAINSGAQAAGNGEISVSVGGALRRRAAPVHQDPALHSDRRDRRDRSHHPQIAGAADGSRCGTRNSFRSTTIGRAAIVAAITKETTTLTQATNMRGVCRPGVCSRLLRRNLHRVFVAAWPLQSAWWSICVAGVIFHIQEPSGRRRHARRAEWDNRLFDRLMDLLDGFKEVRLNRSRSDDLFDDVVEVSRTAANIKDSQPRANLTSSWFSRRARCTCCSPPIVFVVPAFSDDQRRLYHAGYDGPDVRRRGVHGHRANDTHLAGRGRCSGQHRAAGGEVAGDHARSELSSLDRLASASTQIEMRNVVFSYVRQIIRSRLPGRAPWISPCGPAILSSSVGGNGSGQIDISQAALRPVRARFRRDPARRDACRTTPIAMPIAR
mgnify:CR=1 FL=1